MRVAVVSDIHGNYHALEAVLAEVSGEAPDELWCLGDVVGYGPAPNACCALVRDTADLCLAGNHDLAVVGTLPLADFNGDAATAARWTQGKLGAESRAFLASLSAKAERPGVGLFHGSPLDPVWDYVLSEEGARLSLECVDDPLVLVGHSHVPLTVTIEDGEITGGHARAGTEIALGGNRWLLNPGSVGQPRDGDARAAWLVLDFDAGQASFRRVDYPIAKTNEEVKEAGLPPVLGERLFSGA